MKRNYVIVLFVISVAIAALVSTSFSSEIPDPAPTAQTTPIFTGLPIIKDVTYTAEICGGTTKPYTVHWTDPEGVWHSQYQQYSQAFSTFYSVWPDCWRDCQIWVEYTPPYPQTQFQLNIYHWVLNRQVNPPVYVQYVLTEFCHGVPYSLHNIDCQ